MSSNREFRVINELLQGVKVKNLYAYLFQNGKMSYKLNFPREKVYVYMEADIQEIKKDSTEILFKISKVCYYENGSKNEENSQLIGKYLLFKKINTCKLKENSQDYSLYGTVTLQ